MNKAKGSTIGSAAKDLGFKGMWGGLGPRIIMIGTLTALQWFIYDTVKVCLICSLKIQNATIYSGSVTTVFLMNKLITSICL